jgi:transposase
MEGLLVQPLEVATEGWWQSAVARLQEDVVELREQGNRLQHENLELRQQAGYWKSCFERWRAKAQELETENQRLQGEIRKLQEQHFGRKSEKSSTDRRSNDLDDPEETSPSPRRKRGQQPQAKGPQRRDYAHLPQREEKVELPAAERVCPHCGKTRVRLGDTEDSTQIEIETEIIRRVIRRERYRATCSCGTQRTFTAPPPPKLIPKGLLGVSVWREILLEKFAYHRPIARLLANWREHDLDLAPGTIADGLQRLTPLFEPIYQALLERNAQSAFNQADETRWLVFIEYEGKVGHLWWLWAFLSKDTVVYRLDPRRSHNVPENHYGNAGHGKQTIVLLVDRYSAYKAMLQVKDGRIVLAFCWAHVRRDFIRVGKGWPELKGWALEWLRRMRALYRLNDKRLHSAEPAERQQADAQLRLAIAAMQTQRDQELADPKLRAPCRKVLESLCEHWEGLTRFVDDPRIPMDNNRSERHMRGPAVGRKNYYGSAALWSGHLAAMLFSIFATLRLLGLSPRRWLDSYLQACAANQGQPPADIQPFLPWNLSALQRQELAESQSNTS